MSGSVIIQQIAAGFDRSSGPAANLTSVPQRNRQKLCQVRIVGGFDGGRETFPGEVNVRGDDLRWSKDAGCESNAQLLVLCPADQRQRAESAINGCLVGLRIKK